MSIIYLYITFIQHNWSGLFGSQVNGHFLEGPFPIMNMRGQLQSHGLWKSRRTRSAADALPPVANGFLVVSCSGSGDSRWQYLVTDSVFHVFDNVVIKYSRRHLMVRTYILGTYDREAEKRLPCRNDFSTFLQWLILQIMFEDVSVWKTLLKAINVVKDMCVASKKQLSILGLMSRISLGNICRSNVPYPMLNILLGKLSLLT